MTGASQRPIRVLVVGVHWPPETFIANVLLGVDPARVDISVACVRAPRRSSAGRPPGWQAQLGTESTIRDILQALPPAFGRLARSPAAHRVGARAALADRTRSFGVRLVNFSREASMLGAWDVVYFPWTAGPGTFPHVYDLDTAVVVSCRGAHVNVAPLDPDRADIIDDLHLAFARSTLVHCVSDDIAREGARYGLDAEQVRVIRPSVDTSRFTPAAASTAHSTPEGGNGRFELVTTGSLYWRKGSEDMLVALRRLVDAGIDAHLTMIGTGSEEQRVRFTILDLGLAEHVRLLGKCPPDEVAATLRGSDAFVLASLSEGISNAVLEGMASGLPVVTTTAGGMAEAVTDGVEGFLVPPGDPEALAAALLRLARDRSAGRAMGERGRARVVADFDVRDQIEAFTRLFEEAAAIGPRAMLNAMPGSAPRTR